MLNFYKRDKEKYIHSFFSYYIYFFPFVTYFRSTFTNFYIFFLILSFFFCFFRKRIFIFTKDDIYILLLFLLLIFSTLLKTDIYREDFLYILIKSFFNLKFFLVYWIIKNLIYYDLFNLRLFAKFCLISIIFLAFDIIFQHLIGMSSIGYFIFAKEWDSPAFGYYPFEGYYNGFFKEEGIAGSHIQKILLFSFIYFLIQKDKNTWLLFLFLLLTISAIFLTGQRQPFFYSLIYLIILFLIIKRFRKIIFFSFICIMIICFTLANFYKPSIERYKNRNLINLIYKTSPTLENIYNANKDIYLSNSEDSYLTSYKRGLSYAYNSPIIGMGFKSFGYICQSKERIKIACNHPHNLWIEIFVYSGFLGIFLFFLFLILKIKELLKKTFKKKPEVKILLTFLIVELFLIRPYGSIFSTMNGLYFWFLLSLSLNINYQKNSIYKNFNI